MMLSFFALFSVAVLQTPATGEKEIVALILVDAMRADHLGSYGYAKPTTPFLDKLAAQGTRFTQAYVNAPWTRPSTTSFLTGLNASRHRTETENAKLPADVMTIAQRFKKAGYTTAGFTANGNGGSLAGLEKGFDVFEDPSKTYLKAMRGPTYCCNGLPSGEFLTKRVLMWLEKSTAKKIFLFIFYVDPHDPYGAPPEFEKMFLGDFKGTPKRHALWESHNDYSAEERFSLMALYDAGIRFADTSIGQLFEGLNKLGLSDKINVLLSADHGEGFGEHGFYLHAHQFWNEVIHVPLIAYGSKFSSTKVDDRLTQAIDASATLLDVAGILDPALPGHSLLKSAKAEVKVISEYNEFGIHRQAILSERYKVIWQKPADEAWFMRTAKNKENFPSVSFDKEVVQVFDRQKDLEEKNNLFPHQPSEALLMELKSFVNAANK